ncbi:hypothetical protein PENTCL1PPCAC_17414 [Pristionchus entomophagus]|uniref:Peroxisomal membrane protein 4 n=1 Tax=Pristionchus entomophagus TaxID=358040 RepID=A0AAV5TLS8_9BILA|nr:hypothetical protein PENTCL1PPCAC_17414 [Pristionchus entomophagus]
MDRLIFICENWETIGNYVLHKYKAHHHILAAIKGLRNGLVYGARIRAPHALVMVFLFGEGTIIQKLRTIFKLTKTHAINLAKFVFGYKLVKGMLEKAAGLSKEWHAAAAAAAVGYWVFGENNSVNMQINLYLLSRITVGFAKMAVEQQVIPQPSFPVFPIFAAVVWGVVLWMFEYHEGVLQPSLQKSMQYLYRDSNFWSDIRTFLLRNK